MRKSFWKASMAGDLGTRYLPGDNTLGMLQARLGDGGDSHTHTPFLTLLPQCSHFRCPQHPPRHPNPRRSRHSTHSQGSDLG